MGAFRSVTSVGLAISSLALSLAFVSGCGSSEEHTSAAGQAVGGNTNESAQTCFGDACDTEDETRPRCRADQDCYEPPLKYPYNDCEDAGPPSPPTSTCGFSSYNEGLVGGQIPDVAYDPRVPGVAWAAAGPRLFKSTDSGATWSMVYEGDVFGFRKLAIPPGDPKVLVAASSNGIVRSEDGGVTWTVRGLSGLSISSILVHPAEPLRVYAGVRGAGIVRSNDGGRTWGAINYSVPYGDFPSMTADPIDADTFTVAAYKQDGVGALVGGALLRTTNAGQTWTHVQDNPKSLLWEVATCPSNPNIVYSAATNYYGGVSGVLRSNDRGVTWSVTSGLAGKLVTDVAIAPSDCETIYAVHYGTGLKRSTDGGATFSAPLTNGIPFYNNFPRHVSVDPANAARLLGASHGGVLYSADAGQNFAVVGGVMNLAIRSLAASPTDPNRLWMATWGSGIWTRESGSTNWLKSELNVDYAFNVAGDPAVASRTFIGTWSIPYRTTNGTSFEAVSSVPKNPFGHAFDPSNTSVVYMATQIDGLYKSTNGGVSYERSNGSLTAWDTGAGTFIDMRSVLVDRNAPNRVLIGTNLRGIYRSEDGGVTIDPVAPSLASKLVSCLVQDAAGAFYACVDGSGIAKSTDQGATFTYVNTGLPSLNVGGLSADPATGRLYSTSNLGVFESTDGAGSWSSFGGSCLPAGGAGAITIIGTGETKKLVVGTGRGVFAHAL